MAFGKKKSEATTEAVDAVEPDVDDVALLDESGPELAAATDDEPEPAVAATAPAAGADALLTMFHESKVETEDLSVLVELAGESDLDDILEELRTLRAALGITDAYDDEADLAVAA